MTQNKGTPRANIIYKFITKPWPDLDTLKSIVRQGIEYYNLRRERDSLLEQVKQYKEQFSEETENTKTAEHKENLGKCKEQ